MKLTDSAIRNAKRGAPPHNKTKLFDGGGLYVFLHPNGGKYWRLKYRIEGREKVLALGTYPEVKLASARRRRQEARDLLAEGIDPSKVKRAARDNQSDSFQAVAEEWISLKETTWSTSNAKKVRRQLEKDVYPWIGKESVGSITAAELLRVARRIESRGAIETAHRALQNCGQVFRYAVATGRGDRDPTADLKGALTPVRAKHHASVTDPKAVAALLRAIDGYDGQPATRAALRLAPLLFVRPGELRRAEWAEIDLKAREWRIPADKMKSREPHLVPLSRQAVEILKELQPLTDQGRYVFPSIRSADRPMSENTVNGALRRLGYASDEMTGHGFRSLASTLLNEQGWNRDAIERQLAHAERNAVRAAYNYAEHLPGRRRMMQAWADYLDNLKADGRVVTLHAGRGA